MHWPSTAEALFANDGGKYISQTDGLTVTRPWNWGSDLILYQFKVQCRKVSWLSCGCTICAFLMFFDFKTIDFNGFSILFNGCWPLVKRLNSNDPLLLSILDLGKVQCRKVSWLLCQSKPEKRHSNITSRFWILDSGSRQSPMQEGVVILMLEPHLSPVKVIALFLDSRF